MAEKKYDFSIIFQELAKLQAEPELLITADEYEEHEEIRALQKIVLEIQDPVQTYQTST